MTEESLFQRAIEIESLAERRQFLEQECRDFPEQLESVLALLEAHEMDDPFLDQSEGLVETELVDTPAMPDQIGRQVGPYKLLQQIGQGGFGVVYLAEETKTINRRVALKIIKPGMSSKEVVARFQAERQALAMMEHDNIARVFGGGTTDEGLPYFVMELVKGLPITQYCEQKKLSPPQRLELFISVCRGVQHAHQKGVIHRDLKPSNILVAECDHQPVVKIIDFGVAKALNQRLTEQTLFTHYGSVIGTIQYMSPEQAKFNQLDVDTRTDVYSLGAVLYELLTGNTPISRERVKSASFEEVIRWIRDEEPSKPSTKVRLEAQTDHGATASQPQGIRLSRWIRGDLDWIALKALEKDRDRRYHSASELGDDVQRFLNQEPVLASPPSLVYQTRKFVARHRAAVASIGMFAALTLVSVALLVRGQFDRVEADRAKIEKQVIELELKETRRLEGERQAREQLARETIPAIESAIASNKNSTAFDLASRAIKSFPNDERLQELMTAVSSRWVLRPEPAGARVSLWPYENPNGDPVAHVETPTVIDVAKGYYRFRIDREGYESIEGLAGPGTIDLDRTLDAKGTVPDGMVRIPASLAVGISKDYFMDRYEVTNREFKKFVDEGVDGGGYESRGIWEGVLGYGKDWRDKTKKFTGQDGKPGPRHWKNGSYPPGEGDLPVVGICWAEAAAYACSVNKRLPSIHHWNHASGHDLISAMLPASNLDSKGLLPIGKSNCVGPFGTSDMIGNAAEWCFNAYGSNHRTIGGNSFRGPAYDTLAGTPLAADSRELFVGFRCMKLIEEVDPKLFAGMNADQDVPFDGREPVDDEGFAKLRQFYAFDHAIDLWPKLIETNVSFYPGVTRDTYLIDTSYGSQMPVHIYRPAGEIPSNLQMLVFMPGAGGFRTNSLGNHYSQSFISLVRTGRAVAVPILYGMYERLNENTGSNTDVDAVRNQVNDIRRCVDFVKDSEPYSHARLAFFGFSYGARLGPIVCALEPRFEVAIYSNGGIAPQAIEPERDTVHFAPRATQPALMMNGIEDAIFPAESSQKPMFELLGSDDATKEHLLVGIGHHVDGDQLAENIDRFLDLHLGAVSDDMAKTWREQVELFGRRADIAIAARKWLEAEEWLLKQIELLEENGDKYSAVTIMDIQGTLSTILGVQKKYSSNVDLNRESITFAAKSLGPDHKATRRARRILGKALMQIAVDELMKTESESDSGFQRTKEKLYEVEELLPDLAWAQLGLAFAAYREQDFTAAADALKNCESLQSTLPFEFILRSLLASKMGQPQEASDWLTIMKLEKSAHFHEGMKMNPRELFSEAFERVNATSKPKALLKDPDGALKRLGAQYPAHYYLHWLRGLQAIRQQSIPSAHESFRTAFELCDGFRTTDWYCITSQWLDDPTGLEVCRRRLIVLAQEVDGLYLWNGLHVSRAFCRSQAFATPDSEEIAFLEDSAARLIRFYGDSYVMGGTKRMLQYRQGSEVIIPAFKSSNPEEQAESMIFNAITEFQFGDRAAAFEKLDRARAYVDEKFPSPDGPPYKHIGRAHGWCVSRLLLREATSLIELGSEEFDLQVAEAVRRLRADLGREFGNSNAKAILLNVGSALVEQYSQLESPQEKE